ncbi:MAG: hypothetical protein ACOCUT_03970 [bacterium]
MEAVKDIIQHFLPSFNLKEREVSLKGLPLALRSSYSFSELLVNSKRFLLIEVKNGDLGPRDFKKHIEIFKNLTQLEPIWFLQKLHFNKVQRMIKNGYNFIIGDKQIHLPVIGTSLQRTNDTLKNEVSKLSVLAEDILVYEILHQDLSGKTRKDIADLFQTTKMTAGRAISELIDHRLCDDLKEGRKKVLQFAETEELLRYIKKNLPSPCLKTVYLKRTPKKLPLAGITALSNVSMLSSEEVKTFAIGRKDFNEEDFEDFVTLKDFAKAKLQVWKRPPLFIKKGQINNVDLYLSLKDYEDERVQLELEKLIEGLLDKGNDSD